VKKIRIWSVCKALVCLSTGSNQRRRSAKLRLRPEDGDGGGGQARCMSEGHPGGKLGMLCCWLSSSPLGSTALPQSHNYPLLQQAYALTASETPRPRLVGPIWTVQNLHSNMFCTVAFRLYL
jgi:hypothetical protein